MFAVLTIPATATSIFYSHTNKSPPSVRSYRFRASFKSQSTTRESLNKGAESVAEQLQPPPSVGATAAGDDNGLSGIHVPRQKYISVPKADLLHAILSMFQTKEDADEFARFFRCLDSILHAEHKVLLEELRLYYSFTNVEEESDNIDEVALGSQEQIALNGSTWKTGIFESLDFNNMATIKTFDDYRSASTTSRIDLAINFQKTFMKLLHDAQFEEISADDLLLTSALKTDYLLTLPIYVDWRRALESNAIIFRRGYATERQNGLLIVEKLDYLQSKVLQETFFHLSKPLKRIGIWISEAVSSQKNEIVHAWVERAKTWLMEQSFPQNIRSYVKGRYDNQLEELQNTDNTLPIWYAAQRAVPLYEGFLSSVGPRGRLLRKFLTWTQVIPSSPEMPFESSKEIKWLELYLRPKFIPRITLSDIWKPATKEYCGNNLWEMLKTGVSILFTKSLLQEPAFQELILLYTDGKHRKESIYESEVSPLHLKIYGRIPIPDFPVIFPHKKLSFRILDTIRLDIASILGLLAYFLNYKFETIISSPSAFLLDVVAISALILYATRVVLGYKQTWDRYQLLVNRTLYEKTIASGFGSVQFLLDASEQQKHKEAILAYALLLHGEKCQMSCRGSIKDACERFIFEKFGDKVEMPVNSAMETLLRLGIVKESQENMKMEALPCSKAYAVLKHHWDKLLLQEA